jgi:hypothetical protein
MVRTVILLTAAVAGLLVVARPASAQSARPSPVVEISVARGAFLDETPILHGVVGGSARWYISRRVSLGPEVTYMAGPRSDRDLFVTGNLTVDLRPARPAARFTPYLVAGAGLFRHSDTFSGQRYTSSEGAVTAGAGVRIAATPRLWIAPELRVGWEPHTRVGVTVGYRLKD